MRDTALRQIVYIINLFSLAGATLCTGPLFHSAGKFRILANSSCVCVNRIVPVSHKMVFNVATVILFKAHFSVHQHLVCGGTVVAARCAAKTYGVHCRLVVSVSCWDICSLRRPMQSRISFLHVSERDQILSGLLLVYIDLREGCTYKCFKPKSGYHCSPAF